MATYEAPPHNGSAHPPARLQGYQGHTVAPHHPPPTGSSPQNPAVPCQLVLYDNDAVDVTFTDGSRLQMSACASAFAHHQPPPPGAHPLNGKVGARKGLSGMFDGIT